MRWPHPPHAVVLGLALLALSCTANAALSQGVAINGSGAPADTSAILDLASTAKGFLPPRMTAAQRAAIVQPATGLLVYQTDGTPGLYYNTGTPAVPNWKLVADGTSTGPWSLNGSSAYYNGGNVGVGTASPTYPLSVMSSLNGLRVQTNSAGGTAFSVGGFGTIGADAPGVTNGRFSLLENGNLGLGVAIPTSKLSFAPILGKKISLYPGTTGDAGFGVAGNRLQIYSDNPNADVAVGYDAAGTFNERFAFKPNGALAVNGNIGTQGQLLASNGPGAPAAWVSPTAAVYDGITQTLSTSTVTLTSGSSTVTTIPGLSQNIVLHAPSRVLVSFSVPFRSVSCFACGDARAVVDLMVDPNVAINQYVATAPNGEYGTISGTCLLEGLGTESRTISIAAVYATGTDVQFGSGPSVPRGTLTIQVVPQ